MSATRITTTHLREANARRLGGNTWCVDGARAWCARHSIDWRAFVRVGVPVETVAAIGDEYAQQLVALAHELEG